MSGPYSAGELLQAPHLGRSPLGGDTRAETPSREQANDGPNPADIGSPLARLGNPRPVQPSALDDLLLTPQRLGDVAREVRTLRNIMAQAFAPLIWVNTALVDTAGTALGSGGFLKVFPAFGGAGAVLRNIQVGGDGASVLRLFATKADALYADLATTRLVASARITAQLLTQWVPVEVWLEPNEALYLYDPASSVRKFDFAAEWRARRSE